MENKEDRLKVYAANWSRKQFACNYYRLQVPLRCFEDQKLAMTWEDRGEEGKELTLEAMVHTDFALFWGLSGADAKAMLQDMTTRHILYNDGQLHCPPTVITDVDDNRDYLHPHNPPGFVDGGVRGYPDLTLLKPGARVVARNEDDSEHVLWEDKVTWYEGRYFDVERNLNAMKDQHEMHRMSHGMTTPSPHLAKYLKEVIGVKHVHVFPNTIIPSDYESFDLHPKFGVRILWQGGCSHQIDWYPLRHAIKKVCEDNSDITIVIFGDKDKWVADYVPAHQIEFHPWVDYAAYKLKRALLQIDINLCPLAHNLFNICKSAIKWYEGSIWNYPEATLAANVSPYADEMVDGETGMLYDTPDDFAVKLTELIRNAELRKKVAHNAKKWVLSHRTPAVTIPPLWEFYNETRSRRIHDFLSTQGVTDSDIKRLAVEAGLRSE